MIDVQDVPLLHQVRLVAACNLLSSFFGDQECDISSLKIQVSGPSQCSKWRRDPKESLYNRSIIGRLHKSAVDFLVQHSRNSRISFSSLTAHFIHETKRTDEPRIGEKEFLRINVCQTTNNFFQGFHFKWKRRFNIRKSSDC